jgi:hypothetical protein
MQKYHDKIFAILPSPMSDVSNVLFCLEKITMSYMSSFMTVLIYDANTGIKDNEVSYVSFNLHLVCSVCQTCRV